MATKMHVKGILAASGNSGEISTRKWSSVKIKAIQALTCGALYGNVKPFRRLGTCDMMMMMMMNEGCWIINMMILLYILSELLLFLLTVGSDSLLKLLDSISQPIQCQIEKRRNRKERMMKGDRDWTVDTTCKSSQRRKKKRPIVIHTTMRYE